MQSTNEKSNLMVYDNTPNCVGCGTAHALAFFPDAVSSYELESKNEYQVVKPSTRQTAYSLF